MPITMPTKVNEATPQPAPKIGQLLGRGSIAIVREGQLEIISPAGTVVARGSLTREVHEWFVMAVQPWSKNGTLLAYQPRRNVLRIMDFASGEDRLLVVAPEDQDIMGPFLWINNENEVIFHLTKPQEGTRSLWKIGRDGTGLEKINPVLEPAEGEVTSLFATDVSSDGSKILMTVERNIDRCMYSTPSCGSVYVVDIGSYEATRITPIEKYFLGGHFLPNDRDVLVLYKEVMTPNTLNSYYRTDVYLTDITGRQFVQLARGDESGLYIQGISPDGTKVALAGGRSWHPAAGGPNDTAIPEDRVLLLDLTNDIVNTLVPPSEGVQIWPLGFSSDGQSYLVRRFPCVNCAKSPFPTVNPDLDASTSKPQTFSGIGLPPAVLEAYSLDGRVKNVLHEGITKAFLVR